MKSWSLTVLVLILALSAVACGDSTPAVSIDLSPGGEAGLAAARAAGCAACHGSNGEGVDGLGTPLIGLFGSQVTLEGGAIVTADREYLSRAITDPKAEIPEGNNLPMPAYELADADLEVILDYLEEIG
jgi:cytochrome c oxidase subunit 2